MAFFSGQNVALKPFGGRALSGPDSGAYSAPLDPLAVSGRVGGKDRKLREVEETWDRKRKASR